MKKTIIFLISFTVFFSLNYVDTSAKEVNGKSTQMGKIEEALHLNDAKIDLISLILPSWKLKNIHGHMELDNSIGI